MFLVCLSTLVLMWIAMSLVQNIYQLAILRTVWGLTGGVSSLATAMVTLGAPRDQMSKGLGLLQATQFAAFAVGPAAGGFLADQLGIRQSFYLPAVFFLFSVALTAFLFRETGAGEQRQQRSASRHLMRDLVGLPAFLPIMAVLFLVQWVEKGFTVTIPLFVAAVESSSGSIASISGVIISSGAIAGTISAATVGRPASKRLPQQLLTGCLVGGLVVSAPMALISSSTELMVLRASLGLLAGGSITLAYTVAGLALPTRGRAAAMGVLSSGYMFGSALSPMANGLLAGAGIHLAFGLNAVFYGLALLALMLAVSRLAKSSPPKAAGEA